MEIKQLELKKDSNKYEDNQQTVYLNDREVFAKPFILQQGSFLEKHIKKWFPKFNIEKMIQVLNEGNFFNIIF